MCLSPYPHPTPMPQLPCLLLLLLPIQRRQLLQQVLHLTQKRCLACFVLACVVQIQEQISPKRSSKSSSLVLSMYALVHMLIYICVPAFPAFLVVHCLLSKSRLRCAVSVAHLAVYACRLNKIWHCCAQCSAFFCKGAQPAWLREWLPTGHGKALLAEWYHWACAVVAPSSPQTHAQAAASLVEAATTGQGQEADAEGKKERRTRRKKDPAAPKKALTAYLVFINSKREQIIKEHPTADLKDQVTPFLVLLLADHHSHHSSS